MSGDRTCTVHLASGEYVDIQAGPGVDDRRLAQIIAVAYPNAVEFRSGARWLVV